MLQRPVATRELKDYPWLLVRLGLVSVVGKTMPNGRKCSIGTVILLSHIGSGLSELRESTAVELDIDRCRVSTTINEMVGWGWVVRSESGALSVDFDEIGNFVGMSKSELISGQFLHVPRFMLASDVFHDAACVVFGDLVSQSLLDHPRGAMKNPELAELLVFPSPRSKRLGSILPSKVSLSSRSRESRSCRKSRRGPLWLRSVSKMTAHEHWKRFSRSRERETSKCALMQCCISRIKG